MRTYAPMPSAPSADNRSGRLVSLDAARGFDMFWIVGGGGIVHALAELAGWQPLLSHVISSARDHRTKVPSLIGRGIRQASARRYTCRVEHPPSRAATARTSSNSAETAGGSGPTVRPSAVFVSVGIVDTPVRSAGVPAGHSRRPRTPDIDHKPDRRTAKRTGATAAPEPARILHAVRFCPLR